MKIEEAFSYLSECNWSTQHTEITNHVANINGSQSRHPVNLFFLPEEEFQKIFGLPVHIVLKLYFKFISYASEPNDSRRIPFYLSLPATLSFLVHGHLEYIQHLDCFRNFSKTKLLQCVAYECEQIVLFLTPSLVKFPVDPDEIFLVKHSFENKFAIPGVVGVLDCFFVRIRQSSSGWSDTFKNRNGDTAVNVQVICDNSYRFLNVNARFPGSCSDIYIWKRTHVRYILRNLQPNHQNTWLVADRGYHLESTVMNPYRNACTFAQKSLNTVFKEVHEVMNKALALLQARFRCLKTELPFNHDRSANIITACVTLHNYLLAEGYPIEDNISYIAQKKANLPNARFEDLCTEGLANREYLKNCIVNNRLQSQISSWNILQE